MRHALVTGGGKGLGKAVATRLLADGFVVTVTGRDAAALASVVALDESRIGSVIGDVGYEADVAAMIGAAIDARGPVDVLVNNAGIGESAPIARTTLEQWERHLRVNATGVFLCSRAVLASMTERGWGRIVTVASAASHVGWPYTAAYTAGKHAALGFMRVLAAEIRESGVTANCVCPGYVRTEMTERTLERVRVTTGRSAEEAEAAVLRAANQRRLVEPEEVAGAVAYLVSDGAAAINGQSLVIDGGGVQH
ncbi:MAG TPA: SDR family NAD(P)-dependent oxidoreductase [Acidimicrobiales bacterium]|nr:SDR family NAD(P)-dependent oxidoreductase [Acidimicrobiales bacterium]